MVAVKAEAVEAAQATVVAEAGAVLDAAAAHLVALVLVAAAKSPRKTTASATDPRP